MLRRTFLMASLAVIAGGRPTYASGITNITSEQIFRGVVADRPLSNDLGHSLLFHRDGTLLGHRGATTMVGTWHWEGDTLICNAAIRGRKIERNTLRLQRNGDVLVLQSQQSRHPQVLSQVWRID
ncbi:MAG: hypothetical protein AAGF30_11355 [Pseudomonadota bacterium]